MAQAFAQSGHDVTVYTSLPHSRFPNLPSEKIASLLLPEIIFRAAKKLGYERWGEDFKMRHFGREVASLVGQRPADVFISWSSFALETFREHPAYRQVLVRDSTHIEHQQNVLLREYRKHGIELPDMRAVVRRELEEYELADTILVLSEFALNTFLTRGIPERKLHRISLGVNTSIFTPVEKKEIRLPLKALYFGTLSLRKGIYYLLEATKSLPPSALQLTLVGPVEPTFEKVLARYSHARILGPRTHAELATLARENDLYLFPSLEDGFPNTLIQAMAAGLVPITTKNCGPAEWVQDGINGQVIAPSSAASITSVLGRLIDDPQKVLQMRAESLKTTLGHGWDRYGRQLNHWLSTFVAGGERAFGT